MPRYRRRWKVEGTSDMASAKTAAAATADERA